MTSVTLGRQGSLWRDAVRRMLRDRLTILGILLVVIAIACALPYSPLAGALGLTPLPTAFWPWMLATVVAYTILTHFVKTRFIRRYGAD